MTHELTHNYDQSVLLDGHGRRFGNGAESYALGMLQSPSSVNDYYLGLNTAFEFSNSVHNSSPNRFKTREDLQTYMRGVMDVAYTMDLLELEALRESSGTPDQKRNLFFQMASVNPQTVTESGVSYTHYDDELKAVTADVWAKISSLSIDALIDNDIMMRDATNAQGAKVYDRSDATNYTHIHLAAPVYGGLSNDKGVVGGLQARRTAFELLAAKGWDKGYLPYATNQYKAEAEGQGRPLSDTYIFDKVLGQGVTYKTFKKAEYATADANKSRLKGVTVTFQGRSHVINTADDLKALFARAVANDLTARPGNNLQRRELRLEIMRAYNKLTEDFSSSIYR